MNKFVDVSNLQQGTIFLALNNCIPKFILVTRYRIAAGMASTYNACPGSFRGHFVLARGVSILDSVDKLAGNFRSIYRYISFVIPT